MALRVWLPLTGTLENQGISDYTPTIASGNSWASIGKIGAGAITLTKSQTILPTSSCMTGAKQMSYCYWVKVNTAWETQWLDGIRWISTDGSATYTSRQEFYTNCTLVGTWYSGGSISGKSFTPGTWTHIAATFDYNTGKVVFYINGIQVGTTSNLSTTHYCRGDFYIGDNGVNIDENDVRIYDHCLSAAEVHEISQGLVLHYKLDGFMGGTNSNLAQGSRLLATASSLTNHNISKRGSSTIEMRTDGFAQVKGTAAWQGFSLWSNSLNLKVDTTYTYSFYGYTALSTSTNAGISLYPMMYNSAGTRDTSSTLPISVMGGTFTNSNAKQIGKLNTTPQLYWATFTWNQTMANIIANGGKIELSIQIHGTFDTGRIDYLWAPKLELGDKPTAWTPSIEEMGIDLTKIQDSSGYNHNGTINGNIIISSDTNRYNYSTQFDGIDDSITIPYNAICPENIFTFNLWFKKDALGSKNYETLFGGPSGFEMDTRAGAATSLSLYMASTRSGNRNAVTSLSLGNWYMITMTRDGTKEKYYVNGIYQSEIDAKAMPTGVYRIGAWASNTGQNYYGLISDFRIYCTALSAADVKQLYEVGAKVDNLQNLHTFEIKEINKNLLAGRLWSNSYGQHNPKSGLFTNFNSNGEYQFTANRTSAGTEYIPINPTGHTYEYDYTISVNAGNQFYIGFERYDANKTSRSNNACVYTYSTKPSSDIIKQHFKGTVNLSTDGVNPCAFIALRILNGWSGTTSGVTGTATIHNISLREISVKQQPKLTKQGQFIEEELKEEVNMKLHKNGIVETNNLIEF